MIYKRIIFFTLLFILLPMVSAGASAAEILLESIQHTSLSSGAEQVILQFNNGPSKPKQLTLQGERPRVVLDFEKVYPSSAIGNHISINSSLIDTIRLGIHRKDTPKTRVVLDLAVGKGFSHTLNPGETPNSFIVTVYADKTTKESSAAPLKPEKKQDKKSDSKADTTSKSQVPTTKKEDKPATPRTAAQSAPKPTTPPAEDQSSRPTLNSLVFKQDAGKGEMVLFRLNGFHPPIVYGVEEGLPKAVCDFKQTRLANGVKSIKETYGKYVRSIRVGEHVDPEKVRVVIDLEPNQNYDLQQVFFKHDNLFVIIVNTVKGDN